MANLKDVREKFLTDKDAETKGIWKTYPGTDIKVRICRSTCNEYTSMFRREVRKHKQFGNDRPPEIEKKILRNSAAILVKDWNIEDVPCTYDSIVKTFEEMPDFQDWIAGEADSFENYRIEQVEEDARPLSNGSNGNSNGEATTIKSSSNGESVAESPTKLTSDSQN